MWTAYLSKSVQVAFSERRLFPVIKRILSIQMKICSLKSLPTQYEKLTQKHMQYVQKSKDIVTLRLTRLILKVYYRNFCRGILWHLELGEVQHQVKHLKWRWQGNLGFWIPDLCEWNLDPGFQSSMGFQIPWALFRIPKAQDSGFHKQKISRVPESGLDSGFQLLVGFRIPRALFHIPANPKPRAGLLEARLR